MGLGIWMCRGVAAAALVAGMGAAAQTVLTEPETPLLPASFGEWKASSGGAPTGDLTLTTVSKDALEECGPERSQVADYERAGRKIHIEAVQFGDRTGAYSAYTLIRRAGMREAKDLGSWDAVGDGAVLFIRSASVVLVSGASSADLPSLKPLAEILPKVPGNKGVAPLLPTLPPAKGMVNGSLRYAVGPVTYALEGGVLPAKELSFDKAGEAVTALYEDKRGKETLTVLLYPTPAIAGRITSAIQSALPQLGPQFAAARVKRDAEAVSLASGSFSAENAQKLVEAVHLRQQFAVDPDVDPVEPSVQTKVVQTYSLLQSIAVLAGVLMAAAVLLGLFLGGGRALYRVLRGKPAAMEAEFLGLGLSPQNKPADFHRPDAGGGL
jgi:hypothetical protein